MQMYKVEFIKKVAIEVEVAAKSLDDAYVLAKDGEIDLSDAKEIDGSDEIYYYEATPVNNLSNFQSKILHEALKYEFIKEEDLAIAESIILKYTNDFDLLESEVNKNSIGYKLALASQI